eukprot:GCRY01005556.1.p1 GENE.GCRY01005556.1~~GCRY01005556.1.p1  ORF type:complete len:260 (-),score=43.02 GCRY01005556.1:164-943(-)
MEFEHLETRRCEYLNCSQLDYLLTKCPKCHLKLCKQHLAQKNHQCPFPEVEDVKFPTCPLCSQFIHIKNGDNVDVVLNRHIERGCPKETIKTAPLAEMPFACRFPNCKGRNQFKILCEYCRQNFCIQHRFPEDHNCTRFRKKKKKLDSNATAAKDTKVRGDISISHENRVYVSVTLPHRNNKRIRFFFSKTHTVSKAVDTIDPSNKNHVPGQQKFNLFVPAVSSDPLPPSLTMEQFQQQYCNTPTEPVVIASYHDSYSS